VLQIVARRLSEGLRASDILARLGGDEFVVIAEEVTDRDALTALAQKLLSAVDEPVAVRGQEFVLTASIGISIFPRDGSEPQTLIKNADIAMYRAKEQGRNCMQFYSEQMGSANVDRLALETQLKKAAAECSQFVLHYQPRVSLHGGRITGVEALVRWMNPERGLVPPAQFIPLAEELGLIGNIGDWVLRAAASQATQWRKAGLGPIRVAVNISAQQFYAAGFLDGLNAALKETGLDPGALELEITESVMMQRSQQVAELLTAVRTLGVLVSVDDFGTGYSSLAYLKRLPIHYLKIDRSFVHDVRGLGRRQHRARRHRSRPQPAHAGGGGRRGERSAAGVSSRRGLRRDPGLSREPPDPGGADPGVSGCGDGPACGRDCLNAGAGQNHHRKGAEDPALLFVPP
jgi:predicted signal transduction protein with EAL and GGDEF domain